MAPANDIRQLTWLLAWAVVFCDIGTSVYYVPGILYGTVGDSTPFFILLTTLGFIPLALKYIDLAQSGRRWRGHHHDQSIRTHVGLPRRNVNYHQLLSYSGYFICFCVSLRQ
jgi:hypothetical protein